MSRHETVDGERSQMAATTRSRPLKAFWKRVRGPLAQSHFAKQVIAGTIARYIRFVHASSPPVEGSHHVDDVQDCHPFILTLWHGQHLMAPTIKPAAFPMTAMVSRSDDAELNAMVLERFDVRIVRGSGGRGSDHRIDKGGARALIQLKRQLDAGSDVCMIADISKAAPREAGLGIVTLARISGRPDNPGRHSHQPSQGADAYLGQDGDKPPVRASGADCGSADPCRARRRRRRARGQAP